MDAFFNFLQENRMVLIVILGLIAWGFYRLTENPNAQLRDRSLGLSSVRLNRRESKPGDRRVIDMLNIDGIERRHHPRRR